MYRESNTLVMHAMIVSILSISKKCFILIFILILCSIPYNDSFSFELFKRNFRKSFSFSNILKEHGHMHINRAEANMMKGGKYAKIASRDVIYNDKLFTNEQKDAYGVTNCMRMGRGFAPLGHDGVEINLHHLHQKNDGVIVETLSTYHRRYSNELHNYKTISEINRDSFLEWRREYWKKRHRMRCY